MKTLIITLIILSILFGVLRYFGDRPEFVRYDFQRLRTEPDRFTAGRFRRFGEVVEGFKNLPLPSKLFGLGMGGILQTPYWNYDYVDNLYLTLLYKIGIIGMLLLVFMLLSFLKQFLTLCRSTHETSTRYLVYGGIAGLTASLVHNFADTLWFFPPLSANFWFLMGLTTMIGVLGIHDVQAENLKQESQNIGHVKRYA